jgi:LDH2 family malate/lactate/ureidoglycolate dehydrogenase
MTEGRVPVEVATRVPAEKLEEVCVEILCTVGVPRDEAEVISRSLVTAELWGVSSHGVSRLPIYVRRVQAGLVRAGAPITVARNGIGTALLDGGGGFGHVIGHRAMATCVDRARTYGIGAVAVRNSTHFGIAGIFALDAVRSGMIGIVASNAFPRMPPVGARTAILGTNPLAIGVPAPGAFPLLLDMATSTAALGKVLQARDDGRPIPEGWALTRDGEPTTDARLAAEGLLLPAAGPKGFGLALMLEVLSAVLSGASIGLETGSLYGSWDRSEGLGHFFAAISIESFMPLEQFVSRVGDLIAQVKSAKLLSPDGFVRLPGEVEALHQAESQRMGIPLGPAQLTMLKELAANTGTAIGLG